MKRIIYDHQVFSFQRYGGVSRYFYELAKRVARSDGFSATVVAPLYVNHYLDEGGVKTYGLKIPVIPIAGRFVGVANRMAASVLLKACRPALVHETYYRIASVSPRGRPVVVTVYDMIHEKFKDSVSPNDKTSAAKRAAVSRADRVICISENTRTDLIEIFGADPAKIITIHLGFSLTKEIDPEVHPDLPRPFFLYVGQRGGHKNFSRLLVAYGSSAQLNGGLDLIAFGTSKFTQVENEAILAAGLTSAKVRCLSGDDALLGYLYRRATAFIYPSLYEGFGIPPLEAMSFGCPVLCSNTGAIPEIVGDAGLYFDPRSSEAIRESMELVASSTELRMALIARGYDRLKWFSYDRCAAETLDVYRDVLQ